MKKIEILEKFDQLVMYMIDHVIDESTEISQFNRFRNKCEEYTVDVMFTASKTQFTLKSLFFIAEEDTCYLELSAHNPIANDVDVIHTFDFIKDGEVSSFSDLVDGINEMTQKYAEAEVDLTVSKD